MASVSAPLTRRITDFAVIFGLVPSRLGLVRGSRAHLHGPGLVARAPLRGCRDRGGRCLGRLRSPPRSSLAPARRRPSSGRDRCVGGGVPRRPRTCADVDTGCEGHIDGGAHSPRRRASSRDGRLARPLCRSPAQSRDRGLLHDMGKLSVPDAILQKLGPLDADEFAQIKLHTQRGRELLSELGGFDEAVQRLVLDHHERLDGRGYPRGLEAGDLDLETRILALCDVYDALVSPRVYRPAWTMDEALALIRSEAGTAFDPQCVDALFEILG